MRDQYHKTLILTKHLAETAVYITQVYLTGFDRLVNRLMLKGCQYKLTGEKKCLLPFANTKGVDQPAILSSLICTLVVQLSCSLLCQYSACSLQVQHFSTLAVL